jgi:hypothetical protein
MCKLTNILIINIFLLNENQQFAVMYKRVGIETTFVSPNETKLQTLHKLI